MPEYPTPATYIETQAALVALVKQLHQEQFLAIDTESNNLYAYQERVCLVQISTRTADYIIDPLGVEDMGVLAPLMASAEIEKVFHAAEYDVAALKRDYGYTFRNVFDTMAAARICGEEATGLATLLETYMGIVLDKSHQRDNWTKRPLSAEALRYAQYDTHYLLRLRDFLQKRLTELGHLEEAREVFNELADMPSAPVREFDPDDFWKIGLPNHLNQRALRVLKQVFILREEIAQELDIPPHQVFSNRGLVNLAKTAPSSYRELDRVRGIDDAHLQVYGQDIIDAVRRGVKGPKLPRAPRPSRPPKRVTARYTALHAWRRDRANQRGVESDVIISKQLMWDIAQQAPRTLEELEQLEHIGPWRLATYGEEILDVLDGCK